MSFNSFAGKFLSVDIYLLHIINEATVGFYYDSQIVLEISPYKLHDASGVPFQYNFIHEVAHRLYRRMIYREETKALIAYLKAFNENHKYIFDDEGRNAFKKGYVSAYASGAPENSYKPEEEFAETFSFLVHLESKRKLMEFVRSNPASLLAAKINRFQEYLAKVIPSLSWDEVAGIQDYPGSASPETLTPDEKALLSYGLELYDSFGKDRVGISQNDPVSKRTDDEDVGIKDTKQVHREDTVSVRTDDNTVAIKKRGKTKKKEHRSRKGSGGPKWLLALLGVVLGLAMEYLV